MRETTKQVTHEVDGKELTFQIRKMNALQGAFLIKFVTEKLLPLLDGLQNVFIQDEEIEDKDETIKQRTSAIMEMIPKALSSISEEELMNFEMKCLQTVDLLLPAGWQPVMVGKNFTVEDIEYEPLTALLLCYDVIEFNFRGFFGGKGLSSLLPRQSSSLQDA